MQPFITSDTRPLVPEDATTWDPTSQPRDVGADKIKVPKDGDLSVYLGDYAQHPGVLTVLLDDLVRTPAMITKLAHPSETTTMERQIKVEGFQLISASTSERTLDKITHSLITRLAPNVCKNEKIDAILTAFGFRSDFCDDKLGYIDRLVALQLIVRAGIEVHRRQTTAGNTIIAIPLIGYTASDFNTMDWDARLTGKPAPGTETPQKRSEGDQIVALEAAAAAKAVPEPKPQEPNPEMLQQLSQAITELRSEIKTIAATVQGRGGDGQAPFKRVRFSADPPAAQGTNTPAFSLDTPFTPPHTIPGADKQAPPNAEEIDVSAVLQLDEVDPDDSVNSMVIPEVAALFVQRKRITAEHIHSITCTQEQDRRLDISQTDNGTYQVTSSTTSARKIRTFGDLLKVTNYLIDSIYSVQPEAGFKLRQVFVNTIFEAHEAMGSDIAKSVAYWNAHVQSWIKNIKVGINTKLKYSKGLADEVSREFTRQRATDRSTQDDNTALRTLTRQVQSLVGKKSGGGGGGGGGGSGGGGGGGTRAPKVLTGMIPDSMRNDDCVSFLAGRDCKFVDSNGVCVFKHEGLVKGSDPDAPRKRFEASKKPN